MSHLDGIIGRISKEMQQTVDKPVNSVSKGHVFKVKNRPTKELYGLKYGYIEKDSSPFMFHMKYLQLFLV